MEGDPTQSRRNHEEGERLAIHSIVIPADLEMPLRQGQIGASKLSEYQAITGGFIERVGLDNPPSSLYVNEEDWGRYEPVIRRWEAITGQRAPPPTERGTRGQTRLAARFSEWLMGLPLGFVTELGLPYTAQHRLLGNGVVSQQAEAALAQLTGLALWSMEQQAA